MLSREDVGRVVRETWEAWAREQPDVAEHPSWLVPWDALPERDREVDMRIGDAVVNAVSPKLRADAERLTRELRAARAAIRDDSTACVAEECDSRATHWIADGWFCDHHAPRNAHEMRHAPAIRAAEGDE